MEQYRDIKKDGYPKLNTVVEVWIEENEMPFQAGWRDDGFGPCWHSENYEVQENKDNIQYWRPIRLDRPGTPSPAKAEREGPKPISSYLKEYSQLKEYEKLLGGGKRPEYTLELVKAMGWQEVLHMLTGYVDILNLMDGTIYALEEGAAQWEAEAKERDQEGLRWVPCGKEMPPIEDWYDELPQFLFRAKGDDPRSGWVYVAYLNADEIREVVKNFDYCEWLRDCTPQVKDAGQPTEGKSFDEDLAYELIARFVANSGKKDSIKKIRKEAFVDGALWAKKNLESQQQPAPEYDWEAAYHKLFSLYQPLRERADDAESATSQLYELWQQSQNNNP